MRSPLTAFLLILLLLVPPVHAITIHVPSEWPTIQAALNACAPGDSVIVSPGTYVENVVWPSTPQIHVSSESGPAVTIIDGGQPTHPDTASVIVFSWGLDSQTVLDGFTITNGAGTIDPQDPHPMGGGILCAGASPSIINNVVSDNTAYSGGGIACRWGAEPVIAGNSISNNHSTNGGGGGIAVFYSSPIIEENSITDNTSSYCGGGIRLDNSYSVMINGNDISRNSAPNWAGGGIDIAWNSTTTISGNTINQNIGNLGGGIAYHDCTLPPYPRIVGNTIDENTGIQAAGIFLGSSLSAPVVEQCSVSNNFGIGIFSFDFCKPTIESCTIANNTSHGIRSWGGSNPQIHHSDIYGHAPNDGLRNDDPSILVAAEFNWWGHPTGPYHPTTNPDGQGDPVSDYVHFEPWSTSADLVFLDGSTIPARPVLHQNYPNPFNPATRIRFDLPVAGRVSMRIYDSGGHIIRTLLDERLAASSYEIVWDGRDDRGQRTSSGVYFYRIRTQEHSVSRTLVMVE